MIRADTNSGDVGMAVAPSTKLGYAENVTLTHSHDTGKMQRNDELALLRGDICR